MNHHAIVVFPDGKTWSTLDGCTVMVVSEPDFQSLCEDRVDARDLDAVVEFDLVNFTERKD